MSDFDLVRNRRRGEEAKNRVMNRLANPQPVQQQESAFDAVRNRASGYNPVRSHLEATTDRADRMTSSLPSEDVAAAYKPQTIQLNADRADRMMSTVDSSKLRAEIEAPKIRSRLMPAEDKTDLAYSKLGPEKQLQIEREKRYAADPPVIEGIHRGLDKFADFVKPATDIAQTLYTPGAGLTVMNMGTQAAGNLISKVAPGLGKTLGGRVVKTGAQEAIVGAPLGAGMELSRTADEREALKGAAWGAGGGAALGAMGPVVGAAWKKFISRPKATPEIEQRVTKMLELPAPRARGNANTAQTPDVVYGEGKVYEPEPLGLPQGNVVPPTVLRPATNNAALNSVMERIKPVVTERMTPPLENPNELAKWVQKHLGDDISLNEIRRLPYEDLRQMAEMMRARLNVSDEAHKAASELGYRLDELLNGKLPSMGQRVAQNAQERTYGVYPESLPNVRTPQFNREVVSSAAAPVERVGRAPTTSQASVSEFDEIRKRNKSRPTRATEVPVSPKQAPSPATAEIRPDTKQVDFFNGQIKNHSDKAAYHENEIATHVKYLNRVGDRNKAEIMKRLDDVNADIAKRTAERTHHDVKVGDTVYWKDKWDVRYGTIDEIENGKARIYERTNSIGQIVEDMNIDHLSNDPNKAGVLTYSKEQLESLHNLKGVIEGKLAKTHDFSADDTVKYHTNKAKEYRSQEETVRKNLAWLSQESEETARAAGNKNANQFDTVRNRNKPKAKDETVSSAPEREAEEIMKAVKEPRVRDRITSYLDDAEKAALERIAKRKNNLSSNPFDEWADHAIVVAAQLAKGTIKAATYTEDMVKLFGEQIRPHAQRVFAQAKEVLRQQERRASKEGQDAQAFNESGIGDSSTFGAKISRTANKKKGSFSQWWENTRTQLVDDVAPLEGLEKRVRGGKLASAEDSLYKAARMFKGVPEKSAQIVTQRLTPIVEAIEKAGYTSDELGKFALAKHAKDVNAAGFKSGFTNAEIESVLIKYDSDAMNAAQKELVKVNNDMLKELVDSGVVSRELSEVLNERWKNYIPLFRQMDEGAIEFETGLSKALANVANPIKSLKGSEKAVIDPLENMVKNIMSSTNAAERNKVALQLPKLAKIDTEGNFIRKLEPLEEVGRKNVVNVKVNGENVKYEVEPEVYKAILNLDKESSGMIINILAKPASLLRAGATLTPEFSLRNPMRDVVQAFIVSKSGFNPIIDFPVGIIQAISKGKLHQEWIENLGAYGNIMSMDRNVHRQALEKVLGEPASKKFVNLVTGKSVIRLLRAISDTTESATKIGEYRAAIRSGATPQEAAYRSRDIMDFARAGTGVRQANKIVAFLNANIQGKSRLIRAIKENPVGTTVRALTAVTIPTIGIYYANKQFANEAQRETIDNAPDWMRNSFWLVAVPGTDVVARIPKPFDLATIFSNLPERALDFVYKNDKKSFDGFLSQALKESALPAQISGLLPFIEGMSNYSFFRQGEIIPQRESGLKPQDQYDPVRTTETAKILAKGADKLTGGKGAFKHFSSPRIMDNTIQGLTAGLGKYATDAVDSILMGRVPFAGLKVSNPLIDRPEAPSKKLEQKPLLRSFLVDPTQGGKVMDQFYKEIDKLSKEKASNKINDKSFGGTKKNPLYLEKPKGTLLKSLNTSADEVSGINKEIRTIERSMTLTPQQKRQQIDTLVAERMKIVKDSVGLIE